MSAAASSHRPPPFSPKRRPTRAQRKAAERRAAIHRGALAAAEARGGLWGPAPAAATASPAPAPARPPLKSVAPRRRLPPWVQLAVGELAVACGLVGVVAGLPLQGHGWRWPWLAGAVALVIGAGAGMWPALLRSRWALRLAVAVLAAVVAAGLGLGVADSVVLHGRVYLDTSPTARAYRLSLQLDSALEQLVRTDRLVTGPGTWARAHYQDYGTDEDQLKALSARWVAAENRPLPGPGFEPVLSAVASAADFEQQALTQRAADLVNPSSGTEATVTTLQSNVTSDIAQAGGALGRVAHFYGFNVSVPTPGR